MKSTFLAGAATLALTAGMATAQDLEFPVGEGDFNWDSFNAFAEKYDFSGETITITGPWTGLDAENAEAVLAYFAEATGVTVNYSGSDSFEQDIVISSRAGSAPNVAVFPQPGLVGDMASQGLLTPLDPSVSDWIIENYAAGQSWVDLGTHEGPEGEEQLYSFFYKVDVKSLVWYNPDAFDELGYEVPETMEDLKALTEQIVEDGETPWCIALGSGAATGWPATDWVEDMMLRTQPPETYDAWVNHEIPFDDPAVVGAIEEFGYFATSEDFVNGGTSAVATTDFRDSPAGLFSIPPECYMHHQASFIPTFFPEDSVYDFFYLPAYAEQDLGQPVLGAGTTWAITSDSEASHALIEYLQTPIAHETWMALSGFLTPHTGVDPELYATDNARALGDILLNATTFRFDGSDLMPGEIGAGAFWTGMVDYVGGADAEAVASDIEARWQSMN